MGEIIKKYGDVVIGKHMMDIELNEPIDPLLGGYVHLQDQNIRIEITQKDFYGIVSCLRLAKSRLMKLKHMK